MSLALLPAALASASGLLAAAAVRERDRATLLARAGRPDAAPVPAPGRSLLRPPWPVLRLVAVIVGIGAGSVVAGVPGAVAGAAAGIAVPVAALRRREARRTELIESQLAGVVATIAAGLRAGSSLLQSIGLAAEETQAPLGAALREAVDRAALGVPLGDCLHRLVETVPTADLRLAVGVIGMHRRTGGDLPSVLDQLAKTLRERRAAAREIRSLTAQARLSGAILGFLPIGFFLFLSATSREDVAAAYHSSIGATAIGLGLAMQAAAFLWIRRLLRVDP